MPNDTAIEGLKTTDTTSFTLTVTDASAATDSQTLTITLNGTNDTPTLAASLTSATYTDTAADDTSRPWTGTLSSTDRDAGDTATYSIAGQVADVSLAGYDVSTASAYGTLHLNSTSGAYTFGAQRHRDRGVSRPPTPPASRSPSPTPRRRPTARP